MMPRLDGYQTCALIKNNSNFKSTPVIMLSSKDGLFDKARGRMAGAQDYLTKPFDNAELKARWDALPGETKLEISDKVAWKMIGFPGLPASYREEIKTYFNKKYDKPAQSIADFS